MTIWHPPGFTGCVGNSLRYRLYLGATLEGVPPDPRDPVVAEADGGEAAERPQRPRVQLALEVVVGELEAVEGAQVDEGVGRHGVQTVAVQVQHLWGWE